MKQKMHMQLKLIIKQILPHALQVLKYYFPIKYGWFGNYKNWDVLFQSTTGYSNRKILEKARKALLHVLNGSYCYERDTVLFDYPDYRFPILSGLLLVMAQSNRKLNLIDFGGSFGSTFFQHRFFFNTLHEIRWHIVEQKDFVISGKSLLENNILRFNLSIEECIEDNKQINAILFSSVLQYLNTPYEFMERILQYNFKFILIDRTPFVLKGPDRLTKQIVHPSIYRASYPCWFFSKKKFLNFFMNSYELITEFNALDKANIPSEFKGFIFRRK